MRRRSRAYVRLEENRITRAGVDFFLTTVAKTKTVKDRTGPKGSDCYRVSGVNQEGMRTAERPAAA